MQLKIANTWFDACLKLLSLHFGYR